MLLILLCGFCTASFAQSIPSDLVINIQAQSFDSGTLLTLNAQSFVTSFNVLRKNRGDKQFTTLASNLPASQTSFYDATTSKGIAYEYCVQSASNNSVSGYVYTAKELPAVHQQGEVLLLIDNTYKETAQIELAEYKRDLIKEGWKVKWEYVNRTQSITSVKNLILAAYNANPTGFKGSILLGHIPVPYSGNIAPDAHTDHKGAWPSDMYYADINSSASWNDVSVQTVSASDTRNHNIIGDGKYDMSVTGVSNNIKLFVGRVDVYNMPGISSDDVALFKQYLNKNHAYRSSQKVFQNRGMVQDNFGYFSGEAFAQNGWRNFGNMFGSTKVESGDYFTSMNNNSYVWSYACGGGTYTTAQGIGTTTSFKTDKVQSVFTMLYGSYFGDWDNQNNFLRAPIASPSSTLVSIWGGRPNWFLHPMTLGEPIGYSYISSVTNSSTYFPRGFYSGQVHQNMQGDPTLRMYMFRAPTNLVAVPSFNQQQTYLQWTPSMEAGVLGYYVYKAANENAEFTLLNSEYLTETSFTDLNAYDPQAVYMVKAVKLEETITGSFYNLSPGVISNKTQNLALPIDLLSFTGQINTNYTNTLFWDVDHESEVFNYTVERSADGTSYTDLMQVAANGDANSEAHYQVLDEHPLELNYYRLKIQDINGTLSFSEVIRLENPRAHASVEVYPSPFHSQLAIRYEADAPGTLHICFSDMYGRIIRNIVAEHDGSEQRFSLDYLDHLTMGIYFVRLQDTENNTDQTIKVFKQ